jgi:Protein required for attachment to host cells
MRNKLLITLDLGCLKAYRVEDDGFSSHPRLKLINSFNTTAEHGRISDNFTDAAGRFASGNPGLKGVRASGERHNIQLDLDKRTIKYLAGTVTELVNGEAPEVLVYFAAEKEIHQKVLELLEPKVKARVEKTVAEDLTKTEAAELLGHFGHG